MLNAVLAGKKRGTGLEGQRLRLGQANGAEDVLTATLFERLSYLPDELFCDIFTELLGEPFGPLESIEFWPTWHLAESERRVEPDALLSDGRVALLVEAKRHDHSRQQYAGQLAAELEAGWQAGQLADECILMTLGGMADLSEGAQQALYREICAALPAQQEHSFRLVCRSWQQLYGIIEKHLAYGEQSSRGLQRLLDDIARSYSWHGLRTHRMRWLHDLKGAGLLSVSPGTFDHWRMI